MPDAVARVLSRSGVERIPVVVGDSFEEKLPYVVTQLGVCFAESKALEAAIRANLKELHHGR